MYLASAIQKCMWLYCVLIYLFLEQAQCGGSQSREGGQDLPDRARGGRTDIDQLPPSQAGHGTESGLARVERQFAFADRIVERVKQNPMFLPSASQTQRTGSRLVQDVFRTQLSGHVLARLYAGTDPDSTLIRNAVGPKLWQFTSQHFTPAIYQRIQEMRMEYQGPSERAAATIKAKLLAELPTFQAHDRAMQLTIDEQVEQARVAAVTAHNPDPSLVAQLKKEQLNEWRLKRSEYDDMVRFVDRTAESILTKPTAQIESIVRNARP